jgi:hypothetical protein
METTPPKKEIFSKTIEKSIQSVENIFPKIYELVENGLTIRQALKKTNFSVSKFYIYVSDEKKQLLKMIKLSNSQAGNYMRYHSRNRNI